MSFGDSYSTDSNARLTNFLMSDEPLEIPDNQVKLSMPDRKYKSVRVNDDSQDSP